MDEVTDLFTKEGRIRPDKLDDLLVEVCSGRVLFDSASELYASRPPTMAEQDTARIIYSRHFHRIKLQGFPDRNTIERLLRDNGHLDLEEISEADSLEKLMERQIKARETTTDPQQKIELAVEIERVQKRVLDLRVSSEMVFAHSAEALAEQSRTKYLISCCTLTGEMLDKPLWAGWETFLECPNVTLLRDARKAYLRASNGLNITIIRGIARSHEWRTRWKASKETGTPVFVGASSDWDANKRNLIWWSDFYDSIFHHPQCPPEDVICNDTLLQDWINGLVANVKAPPPTAPVQQRTFMDGTGRRIPAVRSGQEKIRVNQPYKVRVQNARTTMGTTPPS